MITGSEMYRSGMGKAHGYYYKSYSVKMGSSCSTIIV